MFDKHFYNKGPSYEYHTVTENRAPTDESIRLLKEMEEKVYKNIMSHVELECNEIKAKWIVHHDPLTCGMDINCIYNVNGTRRQFGLHASNGTEPHELLRMVRNALLQDLGELITLPLVREHAKEIIHNGKL